MKILELIEGFYRIDVIENYIFEIYLLIYLLIYFYLEFKI